MSVAKLIDVKSAIPEQIPEATKKIPLEEPDHLIKVPEGCTPLFTTTPEYSTMYHELPRSARFWSFLFAIDRDLAETTRKNACSCGGRLHSANYLRKPRGTAAQLPEQQRQQIELLLRSRRLQEASHTAVGTLPRAKGLSGRHRHPRRRHAAGAVTTPDP